MTLTKEGEVDVLVQNTSRVRTWVQAKQHYKVGIGLANPLNILHIYSGSGNPSVMVESGGTGVGAYIRFKDAAQTWRLGKNTSDAFSLYDATGTTTPIVVEKTSPTNTLRLDASGRVGIGLSDPDANLHVSSSSDTTVLIQSKGSSNDSTLALRQLGGWPGAATGVDLVYDGGADFFMMKGYTAAGGHQGDAFKTELKEKLSEVVFRKVMRTFEQKMNNQWVVSGTSMLDDWLNMSSQGQHLLSTISKDMDMKRDYYYENRI